MEATVRFKGWTPSPRAVVVGMERDNKVFTLRFEGLPAYPGGTAYLHIDFGSAGADSIEIVDGLAEITRNITQHEGEKTAYVEIIANNDVVWHSDRMLIYVNPLPPVDEKIEQAYPTAFEQALAQTAADKAAAAKSAADAAATAAGIVTDEAARQDAERKRVKAEAARETAEANRKQAETARIQEMAEALESVAGVENVVRANEQQRVLAENARAGAEALRVQEERRRETAETARAEAERQRESMETSRQAAETARNAAESGRATAEKNRVSDESQRQQAEMARADAEGKRVQAEQGRVTAEQGRMEAETKREETMAQHAKKIAELETEVAKKAQIDDTTVSDAAPWSSAHIIDVLCPKASVIGNPVVVKDALGGVGLKECKATFTPTQAGTGTPSPDNIRPISGRDSVKVERQEDAQTTALTLPRTIYGGEVDVQTGKGVEMYKVVTLDGTESWYTWGVNANNSAVTGFYTYDINDYATTNTSGICSHLSSLNVDVWGGRNSGIGFSTTGSSRYFIYSVPTAMLADTSDNSAAIASLKSYLAAQYAAGTPVQVAYKLATPVPFTATGGSEIKALEGVNTLLTDGDTISATYTQSPAILLKSLAAQASTQAASTAALERAVTDI